MNYRHSFHAGGACDVVKHVLLRYVISFLQDKNTEISIIDTHAGCGMYLLNSPDALKTCEYEQGIQQVQNNISNLKNDEIISYLKTVNSFAKNTYPGSPVIAASMLRTNDQLICSELHPEDFRVLKNFLSSFNNTKAFCRNGYESLQASLSSSKLNLIFIDPPFENRDEYETIIKNIKGVFNEKLKSVCMVWYPLKSKSQLDAFYCEVSELSKKISIIKTEVYFYQNFEEGRVNGSGMLILNSTLDNKVKVLLEECTNILSCDGKPFSIVENI
jgi:23S rRNA (adenine2030-N6)-methyltransferase